MFLEKNKLNNLPNIFYGDNKIVGNVKFEKIVSSNSTTSVFTHTFNCKEILHLSCFAYDINLLPLQLSTTVNDKTIKVHTNNGGCFIYAILLID